MIDGRLRDKLKLVSGGTEYVESVRDTGYIYILTPKHPADRSEGQ